VTLDLWDRLLSLDAMLLVLLVDVFVGSERP
jgi:hypothetical protein